MSESKPTVGELLEKSLNLFIQVAAAKGIDHPATAAAVRIYRTLERAKARQA